MQHHPSLPGSRIPPVRKHVDLVPPLEQAGHQRVHVPLGSAKAHITLVNQADAQSRTADWVRGRAEGGGSIRPMNLSRGF